MNVQKITRLFRTEHMPVQPGVIVEEEGTSLVFVSDNGVTVVRPSTGANGEVFAGFSLSRNSPPSHLPHAFESSVPESLVVELPRTPLTGQIMVKVGGVKLEIVAGAPADATEVQLAGRDLVFFAGQSKKKLFVQFIYEPTMAEARTILGDMPIGGLASSAQGIIGVALHGEIGTTMYDASVDWTGVINPNLGVDGRLTVGGSGKLLTQVTVLAAPSTEPGSFGALKVRVSV